MHPQIAAQAEGDPLVDAYGTCRVRDSGWSALHITGVSVISADALRVARVGVAQDGAVGSGPPGAEAWILGARRGSGCGGLGAERPVAGCRAAMVMRCDVGAYPRPEQGPDVGRSEAGEGGE